MYDIRQFKPALYLLLILGISGFALSGELPGLWLMGVAGIGVNLWLVKTGRFRPMPRWIANVATLACLAYVAQDFMTSGTPALMFVGQFLVLLQLIKLFEQRANRDYGQLLILSLLMMVAAAINTTSLGFAVVLMIYLVLALYCCLLFHLKIETDRARSAMPASPPEINPVVLRQDRRFLTRSMRRLTGLVAVVSVSIAALVFVFFPRNVGANILGPMQLRANTALTGFSENMNLGQVSRILQNPEVAAHVSAWRNGQPIKGTESLYLRGVTHDGWNNRQWSAARSQREEMRLEAPADQRTPLFRRRLVDAPYRLRVNLKPSRSNSLFTLAGPVAFESSRRMALRMWSDDQTLQAWEPIDRPTEYEVWCTDASAAPPMTERLVAQAMGLPPRSSPPILAEVAKFTRRPEIIGAEGMDRPLLVPYHPSNRVVAQRIAQYLQSHYSYTLDLSDAPELMGTGTADDPARDPYIVFLNSTKRGHCWYFAGSMVLMCQSIGVPARLVGGYRCDGEDYNSLGGYYIVRQLHAHAWVEVLTSDGWETFDPTSGRVAASNSSSGLFKRLRNLVDYLQFKWGDHVIAFDHNTQENIHASLERAARRIGEWGGSIREWFESAPFWNFFSTVLGTLIALMTLALVSAIILYLVLRLRLRRRARRIGMAALPVSEQLRLVRQLAFYDELMNALARHELHRPRELTHREFAKSMTFLPAAAFDAVRRLTEVFYRVRFGGRQLRPARQRRLLDVVARLNQSLDAAPPLRG